MKKQKTYYHRLEEDVKINIIAKFHGNILQNTNFMAMKVFTIYILFYNDESNYNTHFRLKWVLLVCAITIIYEIYKLHMAIIPKCYNISP